MKYDFGGYATKNDQLCADGLTIRHGAFDAQSGTKVPLVWNHNHENPERVLGHAVLSTREDGVYADCVFNDTPTAQHTRMMLKNGDVDSLSIWANGLVKRGKDVLHGVIREVSLVLAGANPGAKVEYISHGFDDDDADEAILTFGELVHLAHADDTPPEGGPDDDETIADIIATFDEKQRDVFDYMIEEALNHNATDDPEELSPESSDELNHSDEQDNEMPKTNIFEGSATKDDQPKLTHAQIAEIFADAPRLGSLKESFLQHAATYGIEDIDFLFPDAKTLSNTPAFIRRRMEWVSGIISGTAHIPFARVKTLHADITADEARAKGYVKGNLKKDEVIKLLKRSTDPKTIYKKQKLDRDDILDITDFDVVAWLKAEMRVMLEEEIARAILVGDGREADDEDKIDEDRIRPIYTDADMYAVKKTIPVAQWEATTPAAAEVLVDKLVESFEDYEGSGTPTFYCEPGVLTRLLLIKDADGRRIYKTLDELKAAMRVSAIVEVPVMKGLKRTVEGKERKLLGIVVNIGDYGVGTNAGGQTSMFDDFNIDYNQYLYLIETRLSGALTRYRAAMVIETVAG